MPAFPFYGGPPGNPDMLARGTLAELIADLNREGVERALVLPNYGMPDASLSFGFNPLVLAGEQAARPRPGDATGAGHSQRGRRRYYGSRAIQTACASISPGLRHVCG